MTPASTSSHRPADTPTVLCALVTGAASGIGRALTNELVRRGHRVWGADIDLLALEKVANIEGWPAKQVHLAALDIRDPAAWTDTVSAMVQTFGRIDVLMNVAGVIRPGYLHETTAQDVSWHLDVNTKGTIFGTQAAIVPMRRQGSGHIINVASMAGLAGIPGLNLYTASKFAVRGFSLAIAPELRSDGIFVTVVCPDAVRTPMVDLQMDYPQAALTFSGRRMLEAEDVARAIIERGLGKRPLELVIPRSRGLIAKLTGMWPGLAGPLLPLLMRRGLARQAEFKGKAKGTDSDRPHSPPQGSA